MKLRSAYQLLLLILVVLGVYYPSLFAPFNSLDDQLLVNQLLNQQGFSLARHFSPGGIYDYFRPLVTLSFEIDKYVGGLQEPFMHLVNVLVHTLNVVLVYLFAGEFGRFSGRDSSWLPFLSALLFAVHPIHAEAVNWIMGRSDLLAGTFVLAALLALLRCLDERSLPWGGFSALALLLGALCKETALFMLPGACFLLICRPLPGSSPWRLRWVLPGFYGLAVTGYFLLRWGAFKIDRGLGHTAQLVAHATGISVSAPAAASASDPFPLLEAIRVILKASGYYAVKLFQPLPLNFAIHRIDPLYIVPGILLLGLLLFMAWRRHLVGWLFLLSASIAVSALFVVFTQLAWSPIAERYMYVPCAPFVVAVVFGMAEQLRRPFHGRLVLGLLPLLVGAAIWATASRNIVWQDNLTLYQDTVDKNPDFAPAINQLAVALRENNRAEEARVLLARNRMPDHDVASLNYAAALWQAGDYAGARADLLGRLENAGDNKIRILEMLIGMTTEHINQVSDERLKRDYYGDILGWLERLRETLPNGFVYYRIGRVHLILGNRDDAQRAFAEAAKLFPPDSIYKGPSEKLARELAR